MKWGVLKGVLDKEDLNIHIRVDKTRENGQRKFTKKKREGDV